MFYIWQLVGFATGIGQGSPTEGDLGGKLPQLAIQLNKFISCEILEDLLQKRIIGVKVEAVK